MGGVDAVHVKGWFSTNQNDDKPIDVKNLKLSWEDNGNEGFLTEDIPQRLTENWVTNRIAGFTWSTLYRRNFLFENEILFPFKDCFVQDQVVHLAGMCFAKKYLMLNEAVYIYRVHQLSTSHKVNVVKGIKSLPIIYETMKNYLDKTPALNGLKRLKEQCIIQSLEVCFRDHARPLYNGANTPIELDKAVYETLLPMFGENTTIVKHLFHGYNNMWRQAQIFAVQRNYLAQQNHLLQQKLDALTAQQKNLNTQLEEILKELFGSVN